ncbi:MAG: aminopeptidase P family protein [Rubrivivax sp.]|jgi:Xaa-Pro aminopeptidase|nr:aminopeptidase P family protein [Betaproteobacteria bacterium]MBP6317698.1 aminopeptidase P family protein [Rubrivivax sp.]MBK7456856.1 aminopeptidase P family protein [Betaproteobacteria bacterium]MBK7518409.1 aminopeptidase P family protein [Betaproteobacteria bacterium]MBK8865905.1 aminopeptidase P family protein [Betaproteobacteria bacterium]
MDTRTSPIRLRIAQLREVLARAGVHALLVPSADPHLSEYLPGRWQGREWLSGFTGSMGTLVVAADRAALFADSRYWVQAEAELAGTGIELVKIPTGHSAAHIDWLAQQVPRGAVVAVDGQVLGLASASALQAALEAAGVQLRTDVDLLDAIWPDRPALPAEPVYEHAPPQATQPRAERLAAVREAMARHGATHHFVSTVDDLAWITNLRGSDVSYNPVFLAHLLLDMTGGKLFVGQGKVDATLATRLAADGLQLAPYEQAGAALAALGPQARLLVDPKRVTQGLRAQVGLGTPVIEAINPSTLLKSRKSAAEAAFVREAMAEDGAALCEFYAWFEAALARGEPITELTVDERMSAARARRSGFVGLSFNTIAGFNANGAMPHYRATAESHSFIEGDGLLLIDSGGQYLGGTTDITRVWPIGNVSAAMKRDYTLVLKSTMNLSRARFPRGTLGPMLDALARVPLWAEGIDFGHGTGHGVGYFLNVHEGPQSISKTVPDANMAMEPGMITSIEPGVYRTGSWGVRIENLVLNVPASTPEGGRFGEFLEFETLTLCPIDTRCIDRSLLRADEADWLDRYHATVRERLAPRVAGAALAWLRERTEPL